MTSRPRTAVCCCLAASVVGLAGCGGSGAVDARVVKLFGGQANIDAMQAADRAELYRIELRQPGGASEGSPLIAGYPMISGPHRIDERTQTEIVGLLLDSATYDFQMAKSYEFVPGVVVRFDLPGKSLDVVICFSCDELQIQVNGQRVGHEDFDNARGRLLAAVKRLLPEDAAIQKLE